MHLGLIRLLYSLATDNSTKVWDFEIRFSFSDRVMMPHPKKEKPPGGGGRLFKEIPARQRFFAKGIAMRENLSGLC
jgi:hypothetical protein